MSEHNRHRVWQITGHQLIIAVAESARDDADAHLIGAGCFELHIFDGERCTGFMQNGGFHIIPSSALFFNAPYVAGTVGPNRS